MELHINDLRPTGSRVLQGSSFPADMIKVAESPTISNSKLVFESEKSKKKNKNVQVSLFQFRSLPIRNRLLHILRHKSRLRIAFEEMLLHLDEILLI